MKNPEWKIITIGGLRQNDYWDEHSPMREQTCTTSLITTEAHRILVDPGSPDDFLRHALDQRTGLRPEAVDVVFLTHFHPNHRGGISLFPQAHWLMAREEIRWWKAHPNLPPQARDILDHMVPIEDYPLPHVETIATPGHTHGLTSLTFETREGIVAVVGDTILTFDHYDTCDPSAHPENEWEARRSIERIAQIADIIVPGHDNFFVV
ncbi:MAG: MBL fold metallo-hydrolase [bacterium]|jgi:glyoxylase-like metal-dependent hydrolase (beta-lactamase superfamily II)|nr:MBL fold metallo-hydrolase [bacterium]